MLGSVAVAVLSIASSALYADNALDGIRRSTTVHYADLNLNHPAGVAALYRRITVAANRLCGQRTLTGSFYAVPDYTRCCDKAVASAVARVDLPQLSAYYHAHAPRSGSQEIASLPSR
jgi:UrcA family protein